MSALEQAPFEQLDDPDAQTPAWIEYRRQRGETQGDHAIPRGTFEATLIEVAPVRRKDGSGWVIRLVARTEHLGRYVLAWRGLGSNPLDIFDLAEGEVKALRRFAQSMGIPVPAPAPEILQALQGMVGGPVMAKVSHTPVGTQATLYRDVDTNTSLSTLRVAGQVVAADGQVTVLDPDGAVMEGAAAAAFVAHSKVLNGLRTAHMGFMTAAEGAYDLRRTQGWLALGFESIAEYLASPEITESKTDFYRLADIWESYVLEGELAPERLIGAGSSKLEVPLPALKQGVVSAERAAADAEALTRRELREVYRGLMGAEPGDPEEPQPAPDYEAPDASRRRDEPEQDFGDDNSGHDTDCDCKACLIDTWHGETDQLRGQLGETEIQLQEELDRVAELRTQAEAATDREAQLQAELERAQALELPEDLEVVLVAAKTVALTLRRVLVEIGDPKQKRMGKALREAVLAALDEAREHGLDEGE